MSDRIRQPRQERSQATMIRIHDAFEKLLRSDSYEAITINCPVLAQLGCRDQSNRLCLVHVGFLP